MTVEAFLANATHIKGLYVNGSRHWSSNPTKGYLYKTREEILNIKTELKKEPVKTKTK